METQQNSSQFKPLDQIQFEKEKELDRVRRIYNDLSSSEGFRLLTEDLIENMKLIDGTWHLIPSTEKDKLEELRVTKMAVYTLLNLLDSYKARKDRLEKELNSLENKDKLIHMDYDNE